MSRAVVQQTLQKLRNLLDEENGFKYDSQDGFPERELIGGAKRRVAKKAPKRKPLPKDLMCGKGLVSMPAQYGYGYLGGCGDMYGSAFIGGVKPKAPKQKKSPWNAFIAQQARMHPGVSAAELASDPYIRCQYYGY